MNPHQRLNRVICLTILSLCLGLLWIMTTVYAGSKGITANESRHDPHLRPLTQATPTATCPVPPAWGRQPRPTEMANSFDRAGTDRLGNQGPDLPEMWKGYPPAQATRVPAYVPCILLKAMGYEETPEWGGWKQFDAGYGQWGYTTIFHDPGGSCGYGVMQITSGMGGGAGFDPNRVVAEYPYNIGTGARILIQKWNGLSHYIGDNNPHIVEDWYYAVWAYNGGLREDGTLTWYNNPNNTTQWPNQQRGIWECGSNPLQFRRDYPYQELIWGCAAHPPGADFWRAIPLTLPPRGDLFTYEGGPPPTHIDRPEPHHGSCSVVYLPIVLKNYPPVAPTPTPTPTPTPSCVEGSDPIQNRGFETVVPATPGPKAPPWVDIIYDGNCPACYLIWKYSGTCTSNCFYTNRFQPKGVWVKPVISVTNLHWWAGHTVRVSFADTTDFSNVTSFWIDDVTFTLHCD